MTPREIFMSQRAALLANFDDDIEPLEFCAEPAQSSPAESKGFQVLIADPDESLLAEYREHSCDGFEVVTAPNGVECVNRLRQKAPDVLVLEPKINWGGGDGVLAMMHEVLDLATVPVMLLTSSSDSVLDLVSRFPICDYHHKPLSADQLVKRLHAFLEQSTWRRTLAERKSRLENRLRNLIAKETRGRVQALSFEPLVQRQTSSHADCAMT